MEKTETVWQQLPHQDSHVDDPPVVRKQHDPSDLLPLEPEETKQKHESVWLQKQQRSVNFN